ncbi:MAG TPA: hypothetical protein DGG94_10265 [Micromonosporaceae bacterium]|nr:hypothetical protein [Micromonosporaceae bacterium]HCU50166.1 hypothetical protein [Micromonosporaceae bacterium]
MRLSIAIMYHPSRAASAETIAEQCAELAPALVQDPHPHGPPSPLRTAKRAWAACPGDATHHLVLQDDVVLAKDFVSHLRTIVRMRPAHGIALYVNGTSKRNGHHFRQAAALGRRWAPVSRYEYTPTLSFLLPAAHARGLAAHLRTIPDEFRDDDEAVTDFCRDNDIPVVSVVPSLVDHGELPSVAGNDSHGFRHAIAFADDVGVDIDHWAMPDNESARFSGPPHVLQVHDSRCVIRFVQSASDEPVDTLFGWYWHDWCELLGVSAQDVLDTWLAHLGDGPAMVAVTAGLEFWAAGYLLGFDVSHSDVARPANVSPTFQRSIESWLAVGLSPEDERRLDTTGRLALVDTCVAGFRAGCAARATFSGTR